EPRFQLSSKTRAIVHLCGRDPRATHSTGLYLAASVVLLTHLHARSRRSPDNRCCSERPRHLPTAESRLLAPAPEVPIVAAGGDPGGRGGHARRDRARRAVGGCPRRAVRRARDLTVRRHALSLADRRRGAGLPAAGLHGRAPGEAAGPLLPVRAGGGAAGGR